MIVYNMISLIWLMLGFSGRTPRIDGKEFFRQARSVDLLLSTSATAAKMGVSKSLKHAIVIPGAVYHMNSLERS